MSTYPNSVVSIALIAVIGIGGLFHALLAEANVVNELKGKISTKEQEIAALEREIAQFEAELLSVEKESESLEKEIRTIDLTRKKLAADIQLTEGNIESTNLNIERLTVQIGGKEEDIEAKLYALGQSIRNVRTIDDNTLVELVLSNESLSAFWEDFEYAERFQKSIRDSVIELRTLKATLEDNRDQVEEEKDRLVSLRGKLADQKRIEDANRARTNELLESTKNTESNYRAIIAEKEALKDEFERELLDFESQLRVAIDPDSLPSAGTGVLSWPLRNVFITQYFGNTDFARSGAYNGKGHNGIDFRASIGTEVFSAAEGVVVGVGDTDAFAGCYSYGKWVLVEHRNGLSTLYAHLSLLKVTEGQQVGRGTLLGYSGNTGYSTGPHLHFTVYATQGVQIVRLGDVREITNCGQARIPVAPLNAYLNPLDYL